jgi:uncharacterized cupin superfamily protein
MGVDHVTSVAMAGPGEAADTPRERVRAGSGAARVWNAFSDASGRFHAGHWRAEPGVMAVNYTEDELCVILEGRVRLTGPDGAVEFGPGDAFTIAAGFAGTWECIGQVTKIYAIMDPAS